MRPPGHGRGRSERRFEDDPIDALVGRKMNRYRPAQGAADQDEALRPPARPFLKMAERGESVHVHAPFGRPSLAETVPSVVEDKDADAQARMHEGEIVQPVADIPGVAMEPQEGCRAFSGDQPAVGAYPVFSREPNVIEGQAGIGRR